MADDKIYELIPKPLMKHLKQGLMIDNPRITLQASSEILELEKDFSTQLIGELKQLNLTGEARPEIINLATGLAVLAHDMNERASRQFLDGVLKGDCNPVIGSVFHSISQFRMSDFRKSHFGETIILEEGSIDKRCQATSYIIGWLKRVPPADLNGISRIYILKDRPVYDFAGSHMNYLNVVTIVWDAWPHPYNRVQFLKRLFHEKVLYHEIGHHCLDHKEFGQDPE